MPSGPLDPLNERVRSSGRWSLPGREGGSEEAFADDLVRQRPRESAQGHRSQRRAPWSATTGVPIRGEPLARFTVVSTTSRKRIPRPLRCRSYQSTALAISSTASGWNSTRTFTASGGCRQPVRAPGPSQRSQRSPSRSAPSGATTRRAMRGRPRPGRPMCPRRRGWPAVPLRTRRAHPVEGPEAPPARRPIVRSRDQASATRLCRATTATHMSMDMSAETDSRSCISSTMSLTRRQCDAYASS